MRYPEYLDDCAFSCEVGAVKPEAAIYDAALNDLGLAPGETLCVGDSSDAELSIAILDAPTSTPLP